MADTTATDPEVQEVPPGAAPCMPCRGTGRVISHLGGETSLVTCPWCGGAGLRVPGIDAQQHVS
ncbi:MAG TPA: hypothetical protein VHX88_11810 [Solirubrobacteraceae bacterium]|jgi:DnaJ-class molecular chaperone|nr:hypothetical protein [Solirubrobacteraceae bacterium]